MIGATEAQDLRTILKIAVDSIGTKSSDNSPEPVDPYDCWDMEFITSGLPKYPLMVAIGDGHLEIVHRYACHFSVRQRKKAAFICTKSNPTYNVLSLLSLLSGIPKDDLCSLRVAPQHLEQLRSATIQLQDVDLSFLQPTAIDLGSLVTLTKRLIQSDQVEVLYLDSLNNIDLGEYASTIAADLRTITWVLRSVARVGEVGVVAGCKSPEQPYVNLPADSTYHCDQASRPMDFTHETDLAGKVS